jgi:rubredoxin
MKRDEFMCRNCGEVFDPNAPVDPRPKQHKEASEQSKRAYPTRKKGKK